MLSARSPECQTPERAPVRTRAAAPPAHDLGGHGAEPGRAHEGDGASRLATGEAGLIDSGMTRRNAWSPTEGPEAAPQQIPRRTGHVSGAGDDDRRTGRWAPSEGPVRSDPGGPGGEPDGRTVSIPRPAAPGEG
jgi:hypothetical protein